MGEQWHSQEAWNLPSEVRAGTALKVTKRERFNSKLFGRIQLLVWNSNGNLLSPNDGMSTKDGGLFQVSRQQTSHSTFKWSFVVLKSLGEGSETSSIALYDFIWHCFKRPLQPVVVEKSRKTASSKYCHLSVATHPGFEQICLKISLYQELLWWRKSWRQFCRNIWFKLFMILLFNVVNVIAISTIFIIATSLVIFIVMIVIVRHRHQHHHCHNCHYAASALPWFSLCSWSSSHNQAAAGCVHSDVRTDSYHDVHHHLVHPLYLSLYSDKHNLWF